MRIVWDLKWGRLKSDESGYVLIMALFVLVIASLIGVALMVIGFNEYQLSARTKLMDTAYEIAEAGINRACVQMRDDSELLTTTGNGTNNYKGSTSIPQWRTGISPEYSEPFGSSGWEGSYSVSIWQSELMPSNPYYKVIVSRGTVERSGRTAERTIEARIIASAATDDYDASFDYCIYNGFYGRPWATPPEPQNDNGVWPNTTYWLGNFKMDGVSPYLGHKPKGAVYTRGSINIPTRLLSSADFRGNIVATNDVTLSNAWGLSTGINPGLRISNIDRDSNPVPGQGHVIAGLDGTGNIDVNIYAQSGLGVRPFSVSGHLAAATNVTVNNTATFAINFGGASNSVGGIVAGGNVGVTRLANFDISNGGLSLGNIFSSGSTVIRNTFGGGLSYGQISAGRATTVVGGTSYTDLGCHLETFRIGAVSGGTVFSEGRVNIYTTTAFGISTGTVYAAREGNLAVDVKATSFGVTVGSIRAQGKVNVEVLTGLFNCPTVTAGSDTAGNGLVIDASAAGITVGNITARGSVSMIVNSLGGSINSIWTNRSINMQMLSFSSGVGNISAGSDISISATIPISGNVSIGRVSANGNFSMVSTLISFIGGATTYIQGIKAGGNVSLDTQGIAIGWHAGVCRNLDPWNSGPGTPDSTFEGHSPSTDSVVAAGNISIVATGLGSNEVQNTARAGYSSSSSGIFTGNKVSNHLSLRNWNPGVDDPGIPASPWTSGPVSGYPVGTEAWLDSKAPIVNQRLLLKMAGLELPVQLIEPDWSYFEEAAASDEGKRCPSCLKTNPRGYSECQFCGEDLSGVLEKPPHVLRDGGAGDADGNPNPNGSIRFLWDAGLYSSNETIYQSNPDVDIIVDIKWGGAGSDFKGTLVTKGNVKIDNSLGLGWTFDTGQELNLVSGRDIVKNTSGITLVKADNVRYHFWARGNIDFRDMTFALGGVNTFNGSFTAGNRVYYTDTSFWTISTWNWSRWSLDTRAWLPPFSVLSYKEI